MKKKPRLVPVRSGTAAPPNPAASSLLQRIASEFDGLSKQLKVIGQYIEQHREHIGLDRIQDVADRCGVQPSAVIRFAKHFGFSGYTEMQKIFRDDLSQQIAPNRNYQARIRSVIDSGKGRLSSADIAYEFINGSIAGMTQMQRDLHSSVFGDAVDMLARADTVWVVGSRRSLAVAAYLSYALQHTTKRIQFVSGLGGMHEGQLRGLRRGDVMVAISFAPYAEETLQCARLGSDKGCKLVALTDSLMSPLAQHAQATLVVHESETFGFRSLTNAMCLAQSLFIALAYHLELDYQPTTVPASDS
jgi:DNA-binding MurR/RpiR family transcriptional regulator